MIFFWCTIFQLRATIAKLYYKVKYIVKERGSDQSEIFIRKSNMISQPTVAYLQHQIPSGKFSTQLGILSEQMHHLWLFQQHVKKIIHASEKKTKNYDIVFSKEIVILLNMLQ